MRETAREQMLEQIDREFAATAELTGRATIDPGVRDAMARVPRECFVPGGYGELSYRNTALPIGHGQTISQPFIVALMTDFLDLEPDAVVLEVGTGSGYQAAVLAELGARVYSIEIVEALAARARRALRELGYDRVEVQARDGWSGWPEHAPFDGIVVTAVARCVPPALIEQLAPGGTLVIPVEKRFGQQELTVIRRDFAGGIHEREVLPVVFVPLTGGHA